MNAGGASVGDRPLTGFAKLALFCAAGATILLSYLFFSISVLCMLLILGVEMVILIALARFGLVRLIGGVVTAHANLLKVMLRSVWLRKGVELRAQLRQADAPALFELIDRLCAKTEVQMPHQVSIEMGVNAWVKLQGYRRGAGKTVLGVGYDLMAGLSQWEMQGVLAHEITHAKLVQRGYKNWMNRGLGRTRQLAQGLYAHVEGHRKANQTVEPAAFIFSITDRLVRSTARLVAACSRQDEFDADRGAAALCGAAAIRSSLLKLESLNECSSRLPWNERVARLQSGEGFSQWLVEELSSAQAKSPSESERNLFFKYSTHPSLADRLAALPDNPDETSPTHEGAPAIRLLNEPDKIAETLIAEIQRMLAEQERKDSKQLRRWTRRSGAQARLRPFQQVGVLVLIIGLVFGLSFWGVVGMSFGLFCFLLGTLGVGIACCRLGRYRDRLTLPIPEFATLKAAWQNRPKVKDEEVKAIEAELQNRVAGISKLGKKELELASAAYDALDRCDFVRAHIAAGLCLRVNKKSIEGAIALAVSAGFFGQNQQVGDALRFLLQTTGLKSPSTIWAAGWALWLGGDWGPAEAFLEKRSRQKPAHPTLLIGLAICQSNRGKLQSALLLAREACSSPEVHIEHSKFLLDLLFQAGYLREAQEHLARLKSSIDDDVDLILMMVRLNLMCKNLAAAEQWTDTLKQKGPAAHLTLRLAYFYEVARQRDKSAVYYQEALANGFYPEGLVGLARLAFQAQNKEQARLHLLSALNTEKTLGDKAMGPLPLLGQILGQLAALEAPVPECRAWVVKLNAGKSPPGLEKKSLLVYAVTRQQAEQSLARLFAAMQPSAPPPLPSTVGWSEARKELQPDGPVLPGVQGIMD